MERGKHMELVEVIAAEVSCGTEEVAGMLEIIISVVSKWPQV